jgi:hypothetical protein
MGLILETLADVDPELDRAYWIYLLNYGLESEIASAIKANFWEIAERTSQSRSAIVAGTSRHFDSEVLRWDHVFGLDGKQHLPALLIARRNPHELAILRKGEYTPEDEFLLIPLRSLASTGDEALAVLNSVLSDVEAAKPLSEFAINSRMKPHPEAHAAPVLVLQPNFMGLGLNLNELGSRIKARFTKQKEPS